MEADYSIDKKAKPQFRLMIYSAVLAVCIQYLVPLISEQGAFLRRLLSPSESMFENIVPFTIVFLWIWTMLDISSKARMAFKQRKHFLDLQIAVYEGKDGDVSGLDSLHDFSEENYANRRISELLMQMKSTGDGHQAHEHFRHQLVIDADQAAGGYTLAKVFIWAMPIVGFIGTVFGIGMAVAEFATFLTSKMTVDDIEAVKHALAGVAGGLSYAFDTTLLGLTASIVAMLFMSFVQRNDEGFLSNLEQLGLEVMRLFCSKQPTIARADGDVDIAVARLVAEVNESVERLVGNITSLGDVFPQVFDHVSQTIAPLGERIESSVAGLQLAIQSKVKELSNENTRSREDVASLHNSLLAISEKLERICDTLAVTMPSGEDERSRSDAASLRAGLQGMTDRLEQIRDALAGLQSRSGEGQLGEIQLSDASRHYIGAEVTRVIKSISQQVNSSVRSVRQEYMALAPANPARISLGRAVTAGVTLVLLTTLAVSSIVGMREMRTLVENNQVRDVQLAENIIKIAQSVNAVRTDLKDATASVNQALATPTAAGVESEQMQTGNQQAPVIAAREEASSLPKPVSDSNKPVLEQAVQPDPPKKVDEWLAYAEAAFAKDYLLTPEDESAIYWVNRILKVEPRNSKATEIRRDVIDRYLGWAATQLRDGKVQSAKISLSKAEALSVHATDTQRLRLSSLKYELDMLARGKAKQSPSADKDASAQGTIPADIVETHSDEPSMGSEDQGETTTSSESIQRPNTYNAENSQGQKQTTAKEQAQGTNNPIKALGNLFKSVFKNETASDN